MLKVSFRLLVATMALAVSLRPAHAKKSKCPESLLNEKGRLRKKKCEKKINGLTCSYDSDGDRTIDVSYICQENSEGEKRWENQKFPARLEFVGQGSKDNPLPDGSLGLCEGDCNSDAQCKANLRCFIRDSNTTSDGAGRINEHQKMAGSLVLKGTVTHCDTQPHQSNSAIPNSCLRERTLTIGRGR